MDSITNSPEFKHHVQVKIAQYINAVEGANWYHDDAINESHMVVDRIPMDDLVYAAKREGRFVNEAYIRMSRKGSMKPINRKERIIIAYHINKAVENAYYEIELDKEIEKA